MESGHSHTGAVPSEARLCTRRWPHLGGRLRGIRVRGAASPYSSREPARPSSASSDWNTLYRLRYTPRVALM
jgi:hypothetical protein